MNFPNVKDLIKTEGIKSLICKYFKDKLSFIKIKNKKIIFSVLAALLVLIVSVGVALPKGSSSVSQKNIITDNKAEELFYAGQYDEAVAEYLRIFETDSASPLWYLKISEIYSVKGDIENSRKYIQLAKDIRKKNIETDKTDKTDKEVSDEEFRTKDIEVLNYTVFTELMNGDYEEAMKDGEEALQKYGDSRKLIKTMLPVYMVNKEMDKAKLLVTLYNVDQDSAYDIAEYARMKMLLDQWDEGFEQLRYSWYKDKDEYKVFDILAQTSAYNKDDILEKLNALSNGNPSEPAYKIWLAKIYSMREETSELAQNLLDEIKSGDVGSIEKTLIQAAILQNTNQIERADELINRLIQENENDYRVLHTAGWFYLRKNDLDKALEYCKKSIVKNKNYPDNYGFLMPEILKAMGKDVGGEPYFRTALLKEPYNYNIMLNIANYFWYTAKNSEKALEYFKFAEIVKPNDPEIKYNMALIHLTNERENEAVELIKHSTELDDSIPKYHRTLGTIYMTKAKYDDGLKEIREAYQSDKEDILTLNNAGCYYITVSVDLERGVYNLQKAYEGINGTTDEETKKTITENYNKAKKLLNDYKNGRGGETLTIPEFKLFY